jgi:DNA-binding NtrC family response regulator
LPTDYYGPIHLLITDLVMPEINGLDLVKRLQPNRPEMRVLYISGYTDRGIAGATTVDDQLNFLQKPFAFDALGHKLRDILKDGAGADPS